MIVSANLEKQARKIYLKINKLRKKGWFSQDISQMLIRKYANEKDILIRQLNGRNSYYFTEPCINTTAYENTIHGILGKLIDKKYEKKKESEKPEYELDHSLDQEEFLCLHF